MAANHPLAAQAGLVALRDGGQRGGCRAATALALAVVEPMMSGLGGDAFYHFFDAEDREGRRVQRHRPSAARCHARALRRAASRGKGRSRSRCPGMLAGLDMMHRQLRPPAMGTTFVRRRSAWPAMGLVRRAHYRHFAVDMLAHPAGRTRPPPPSSGRARRRWSGRLIVQPELARTLEEIAAGGAETFYRGDLASRLATALAECGALITGTDLAEFERRRTGAASHRLSRLPGPGGATQLDRLRAPPGAEDPRAFRRGPDGARVGRPAFTSWSRPKSSPLPTASAGAATRARSTLRSRSCSPPSTAPGSPHASTWARAAADLRARCRGRRHDLFLHRRRATATPCQRHSEHQQLAGVRE